MKRRLKISWTISKKVDFQHYENLASLRCEQYYGDQKSDKRLNSETTSVSQGFQGLVRSLTSPYKCYF